MKKLGRIPLPRKTGRPQTTKKGKKRYNRRTKKERFRKEAKGSSISLLFLLQYRDGHTNFSRRIS